MKNNALLKFVGRQCEINTSDNYYDGVILSVEDDWLEIDEDGEITLINTYHIEAVLPCQEEDKERKKGLFGKSKKYTEDF